MADKMQPGSSLEKGVPEIHHNQNDNSRGNFLVNMMATDFQHLLECPICYESVLPPIVLCRAGHSVCNFCSEKLEDPRICPSCREVVTQVPNVFAERLLEMCVVNCRYAESGCRVALPGLGLSQHVPECKYRPILCQGCEAAIPYHDFLQHLRIKEQLQVTMLREGTDGFSIDDSDMAGEIDGGENHPGWQPIWLFAYGLDFFCYLEKLNSEFILWVAVYTLDAEEPIWQFMSSITVYNRRTRYMRKFVGGVHSIRATIRDVHESGRCLVIQKKQLRNLVYDDGIEVRVEISVEYNPPKVGAYEGSPQRMAGGVIAVPNKRTHIV